MLTSPIRKIILLVMVSFGLFACMEDSTNTARLPAPTGERYLHQPNLPEIITPYLNEQGYMDRDFPPTVATPSPYLTDFYGIIATKDNDALQILLDFVPTHATLIAQTPQSLTLLFNDGYEINFYPYSSIELAGHKLNFSHAVVNGDTWRENQKNVKLFLQLLQDMGLSQAYLINNEAYASEKRVYKNLTKQPANVVIDSELQLFNSSPDSVLLFSEKVHGIPDDANMLSQLLQKNSFDWLGLEMLNTDMQPLLDVYNQSELGTANYDNSRQKLVDYFTHAWNGRAGDKTSGEENYYFKLVELAHSLNIDLIALEHGSLPFLFFRYGETDFGASVRSLWWAEHLPAHGKGAVFGGGAHYNREGAINVQDFIAEQNPKRTIVSITNVTQGWEQ